MRLFARTGPAGQALSPLYPEGKGDLGESGGAPLQVKRGRGSFRKTLFYDNCWSFMEIAVHKNKTVTSLSNVVLVMVICGGGD